MLNRRELLNLLSSSGLTMTAGRSQRGVGSG